MNDFCDRTKTPKWLMFSASLLLLVACNGTGSIAMLQGQGASQPDERLQEAVQLVEQDVEAPDVFQAIETALWDGRPSLGGTWVAHPDVTEPERVVIRNTSNGRSITGALFRREVENPGPKVQVSSDAAASLGMLAGQPVVLSVTALRREEVVAPASNLVAEPEIIPDPL